MAVPQVKFDRALKFLDDQASAHLELSAIRDVKVAQAILTNKPFPLPDDGELPIGSVGASAKLGKDIAFKGKGTGKVRFGVGGGVSIRIGVSTDPSKLVAALSLADNIAPGLALAADADAMFLVLETGYEISAEAKGAVALGAPTVTFSAEGQRRGQFAIIRRVDRDTGARDAIVDLADSWLLPTQLRSHADMQPGTWIVSEVDATIALGIGAKVGYDFSWVREAALGGITGDIGLHVQLGVAASVGFSAGGRFAVVIGRESEEKTVRLRLFKQRVRGLNAVFNAAASAKLEADDFLPEQLDQFIAAIFTVHSAQILKALEAIDTWTDPDAKVPDLLAGVSGKYLKNLLEEVTGVDPEALFNDAKRRLQEVLAVWHDLDHRVATVIWGQLERKVDLEPVRKLAGQIAGFDRTTAKSLIGDLLEDVAFFDTAAGEWLEGAAAGGIVAALGNTAAYQELQKVARMTVDLLDGDALEGVLTRLQEYIEEQLGLDQIEEAIDRASFKKVDEWVRARIAAFLGLAPEALFDRIDEVRGAIQTIRARSKEFYARTREVLTRKYEAQFSATFQREATTSALLDAVFDFGEGVAAVRPSWQEAIEGKLDGLMTEARPGVTLKEAALTHQIKRHTHVAISLPFFTTSADHFNRSLATVKVINDEDRILLFEADAEDVAVSESNGKFFRNSRLAIGVSWPHVAASAVAVHTTATLAFDYSFRQARRAMQRAELEAQLTPYVTNYFPSTFGTERGELTTTSVVTWITDMDRTIDALPGGGPDNQGADKFGHTLIALTLAPEAEALTGWFNAPPDRRAPAYMEMSRRLQRRLKDLVAFYFFQDPARYKDLVPSATMLVYASMPPSTALRKTGDGFMLNSDDDVYWDFQDETASGQRQAMIGARVTRDRLVSRLALVFRELQSTPGLKGVAAFYDPDDVSSLIDTVSRKSAHLHGALFSEFEIVTGAHKAGLKLAGLFRDAGSRPSKAIDELARFGAEVTRTFNRRLGEVFGGGDVLRPLGTLLFAEAALALAGKPATAKINAMLDLTVLKQEAAFALPTFTQGKDPAPADVLYRQRLVNL